MITQPLKTDSKLNSSLKVMGVDNRMKKDADTKLQFFFIELWNQFKQVTTVCRVTHLACLHYLSSEVYSAILSNVSLLHQAKKHVKPEKMEN